MSENTNDPTDALAVIAALSRFHHCADAGDWAGVEAVLHPDVQWRWRGEDGSGDATDRADGRDAVVGWLRSVMTGSTVRHHTMSHLVDIDGDAAKSESYLLTVDTTSLATLASGVVRCSYERGDGGWALRLIDVDERIPDGSISTMRERTSASEA